MTFTTESKSKFAGLSLVLKSTNTTEATSLVDWLPSVETGGETVPGIIPFGNNVNATKLGVALANPQDYEQIIPKICLQISDSSTVEWNGRTYEVTGVEVDKFDLHVLQIPIYTSEIIPENHGRAIHALCFHWIDLGNSELAAKLHGQENLPFSLAVQIGKSRKQMYLRIGVLQKELLAPLLCGLAKELGKEFMLVGVPCRLGHTVEILQTNNFANLVKIPGEEFLELELLTPTSFKQSQIVQPFPLPELVFNNLWRRWNLFTPEELQLPAIEWQVAIPAFDLKTKPMKIKDITEIGSVGWVKYKFLNSEQAQIATALAYFADFAGIGRKTPMGMGRGRVRS